MQTYSVNSMQMAQLHVHVYEALERLYERTGLPGLPAIMRALHCWGCGIDGGETEIDLDREIIPPIEDLGWD